MEQYIPKAAVVAKIESILNETNYKPFTDEVLGERKVCKDIKDFLNTIEIKEVDLKKEYEKYYEQERYVQTFKLAKHFFELGLRAHKGE